MSYKIVPTGLSTLSKVVARRAIKTLAKCSDAKVIFRLFGQPLWGCKFAPTGVFLGKN